MALLLPLLYREVILEKFMKFIELCHDHEIIGNPKNDVEVKKEDRIIRQIQKEGLRQIKHDTVFENLLNHTDDFVQFWCAMCCVDHRYCTEKALQKLRCIAVLKEKYSICYRAELVLAMFDEGYWSIDKSNH